MLSDRLVQMIEEHAEKLTHSLVNDLRSNKHTTHYHALTGDELHRRTYDVYRHLGQWIASKTEQAIESNYIELGETRRAEGVPLSEVLYALILTKSHLRDYIRFTGMSDSAIDLHRERELQQLVTQFFDKAIYCTAKGYEQAGR